MVSFLLWPKFQRNNFWRHFLRLVLFGLLVGLIAVLVLLPRLTDFEGHGDEDYWIAGSGTFLKYFSSGKLFDPVWENDLWLFHRPEVPHLLIGLSMKLHGLTYEETQIVKSTKTKRDYGRDFTWQKPTRLFEKSSRLLGAARLPAALLGVGSAFLLWLVTSLCFSLPAAATAVYFLLTNGVFLEYSRQAMSDTIPLFFESLILLTVFFWLRQKRINHWLLGMVAILTALSVSIRFVTVHSLVAINLLFLIFYLKGGRKNFKPIFWAHFSFNALFLFTFFILDPTYYRHPWENFRMMLETWSAIGKWDVTRLTEVGFDLTKRLGYLMAATQNSGFFSQALIVLGGGYLSFLALREILAGVVTEKTFLFFWVLNTFIFYFLNIIPDHPRYVFILTAAFVILKGIGVHFLIVFFLIFLKFLVKIGLPCMVKNVWQAID